MPAARSKTSLSRRGLLGGLLHLAWLTPLGIVTAQIVRFLRFNPPTSEITQFAIGGPDALPDLPAYIGQARAWLLRDELGLYAVDAICTHLGCVVRLDGGAGYHCDCHGSRFALDGAVVNGPATLPLHFLNLYWSTDGQLVIDRARQADPTFRLSET
jgi:Rieske Fe-S protein